MRRPLSLAAASATLIAAAAVASGASATTVATPLTSASVTTCVSGTTAAERSASFRGQIQTLPGARTLSISFSLYQRTATGGWTPVSAPGFDVWQSSTPGIGSFTANENVIDLPAPAAFRAVVHYRWLDRRHHVIRRDERVTPNCVMTLPQPNLFVARLSRSADGAGNGTQFYNVLVRNSGVAPAGPFSVALSVGPTALAPLTVAGLAPGSSQALQFTGPRCTAGTTVTAQVDPSAAISEPANPQRTVSIVCGSQAGSGATGASGPG
jgi:hypothetical protein